MMPFRPVYVLLAWVSLFIGCAQPVDEETASTADTTAATAPATDIFLATLTQHANQLTIGRPVNVTQRAGYDNQPHFLPDGSAMLYTSIRGGQADTYRYDVFDGEMQQVTRTPESEYSPTPHGNGLSVVRVEADGRQRLWQFAYDGTRPTVLLPTIAPVGYHAWATERQVALYVLGEPATLQLAHLGAAAVTVARDIGRSLQRVPGQPATISFVQYTSDSTAVIHTLDAATQAIEPLAALPPGGDYHAWTPDGTLLMGQDSTIYAWHAADADHWQPVASLPLRDVTRLAVSPTGERLAIVAAEPGQP